MENLTIADFDQWANHPMTMMVRNYLIEQLQDMDKLSDSAMIEQTVYAQGLTPLEALGLESVMKMSVVKGIELFTNTPDLRDSLFEEVPDENQA